MYIFVYKQIHTHTCIKLLFRLGFTCFNMFKKPISSRQKGSTKFTMKLRSIQVPIGMNSQIVQPEKSFTGLAQVAPIRACLRLRGFVLGFIFFLRFNFGEISSVGWEMGSQMFGLGEDSRIEADPQHSLLLLMWKMVLTLVVRLGALAVNAGTAAETKPGFQLRIFEFNP